MVITQVDLVLWFGLTPSPRRRWVIQLSSGLEDWHSRALDEVDKGFNVTRERIRQIEARSLLKLCHPGRSLKFKGNLE